MLTIMTLVLAGVAVAACVTWLVTRPAPPFNESLRNFLKDLDAATEDLGLEWFVDKYGYIRAVAHQDPMQFRDFFCPLTAVYFHKKGLFLRCHFASHAAKFLRLTREEKAIITTAADSYQGFDRSHFDPLFRSYLLLHTGQIV